MEIDRLTVLARKEAMLPVLEAARTARARARRQVAAARAAAEEVQCALLGSVQHAVTKELADGSRATLLPNGTRMQTHADGRTVAMLGGADGVVCIVPENTAAAPIVVQLPSSEGADSSGSGSGSGSDSCSGSKEQVQLLPMQQHAAWLSPPGADGTPPVQVQLIGGDEAAGCSFDGVMVQTGRIPRSGDGSDGSDGGGGGGGGGAGSEGGCGGRRIGG